MSIDNQIIEAIKKGNNAWVLQTLYKRSLPKVKKLIKKMNGSDDDALDMFQEAVLIFIRQVKTGKLYIDTEVDAYLHRVSRNLFINDLRRKNKSTDLPDWEEWDSQMEHSIEYHLAMKQSEQEISDILTLLGPNCKDLLQRLVLEDMDYEEIATSLGYASADVVKTQKHRCKKKMEELLKQRPSIAQKLGKLLP